MVLTDAFAPVLVGLVGGLMLSLAVTPLLAKALFGVKPRGRGELHGHHAGDAARECARRLPSRAAHGTEETFDLAASFGLIGRGMHDEDADGSGDAG
jgi:hypothetical protein